MEAERASWKVSRQKQGISWEEDVDEAAGENERSEKNEIEFTINKVSEFTARCNETEILRLLTWVLLAFSSVATCNETSLQKLLLQIKSLPNIQISA